MFQLSFTFKSAFEAIPSVATTSKGACFPLVPFAGHKEAQTALGEPHCLFYSGLPTECPQDKAPSVRRGDRGKDPEEQEAARLSVLAIYSKQSNRTATGAMYFSQFPNTPRQRFGRTWKLSDPRHFAGLGKLGFSESRAALRKIEFDAQKQSRMACQVQQPGRENPSSWCGTWVP